MKGLFASHLGKKEEAIELVKKGIKLNLQSHICWHVYGLIHRGEKNYEEAMKCYKNALKFDKENLQIIRDLALLQIQTRQLEGFNETRKLMLSLKPSTKIYWIGLAQSFHFLKDYETALKVLDAYEENTKSDPSPNSFELSEFVLYKNQIIEESGNYLEALKHLQLSENEITDKLAFLEKQAIFCLKLQRYDEAEVHFKNLLRRNSENALYYEAIESCIKHKYPTDFTAKLMEFYAKTQISYPKSLAAKRNPLKFLSGVEFSNYLLSFFPLLLKKGIPSLFQSVKKLYVDLDKMSRIEACIKQFLQDPEFNDCKIWILNFLAQHFDFQRDTELALRYVNEAISIDPTAVELLLVKARIYKHAGGLQLASDTLETARNSDLSDRYLNSKSTKYFLRNDKIDEAKSTIKLFLRETEGFQDLVEMQCFWFANEAGESLKRQEKYLEALKYFNQVEKAFSDILDDQFDFHAYCSRKMTLKSYKELLDLEDDLFSQESFRRASLNAIECYLKLHDESLLAEEIGKLSIDKAKKHGQNEGSVDYLQEAMKLAKKLPKNLLETHLILFQVYLKREKWTLAFKSLKKSVEMTQDGITTHPIVFRNLINFWKTYLQHDFGLKEIIKEELDLLVDSQNLSEYQNRFLSQNKLSLPHVFEYVQATGSDWSILYECKKFTLEQVLMVYRLVEGEEREKFKNHFAKHFPSCDELVK